MKITKCPYSQEFNKGQRYNYESEDVCQAQIDLITPTYANPMDYICPWVQYKKCPVYLLKLQIKRLQRQLKIKEDMQNEHKSNTR